MAIKILETLNGAKQAQGLAVVIDVFRAFSTACYVMHGNAEGIVVTDTLEEARTIKRTHPDWVLMGERGARPPEDFDFGNSPTLIENVDLRGKTVILTTNSGTKGLMIALDQADEVITGAFVNARAIARHILSTDKEEVTLLALGTAGKVRSPEDTMCAIYLKNEVENYPNSFDALKDYFKDIESAKKFFDTEKEYAPERDFDLCLNLDRFNFLLAARRGKDGLTRLIKIPASDDPI